MSPEDVVNDERFASAVFAATHIAVETHFEEKIGLLRSALINIGTGRTATDFATLRLLGLVEELEPTHFTLLAFAGDPSGWLGQRSISIAESHCTFRSLIDKANVLSESDDIVSLALKDLSDRYLVYPHMLDKVESMEALMEARTTELGRELLLFVTYFE
jgi:hypothetical protein